MAMWFKSVRFSFVKAGKSGKMEIEVENTTKYDIKLSGRATKKQRGECSISL